MEISYLMVLGLDVTLDRIPFTLDIYICIAEFFSLYSHYCLIVFFFFEQIILFVCFFSNTSNLSNNLLLEVH